MGRNVGNRSAVSDTVHFPVFLLMLGATIRCLVALHPYSGEGSPPMYGDYEAQRHWMELTTQLPMHEWYRNTTNNPLEYWGLDYPPLTAVQSWLCGVLASRVQPGLVVLHHSRGYETPGSRALMRLTVLLGDSLFYFSSLWLFCARFYDTRPSVPKTMRGATQLFFSRHREARGRRKQEGRRAGMVPTALCSEVFILALLQPGLVLIDHGHFQYNCIGLGLALWAVVMLAHGRHSAGSVAFCLSLNFKQISLYYAPAFFFYLLSRCLRDPFDGSGAAPTLKKAVRRVASLGVVVLATFASLWLPFCVSGALRLDGVWDMIRVAVGVAQPPQAWDSAECSASMLRVLKRLFPFERGLFEDKVANVWCSLDVIVKLRHLIPRRSLTLLSTTCTAILLAPSAIDLLRRNATPRRLVMALFNSSMAFFLFGFQVHEKSILYALLPATLLIGESPGAACWFNLLAVFSQCYATLGRWQSSPHLLVRLRLPIPPYLRR